MLYTGMHNLSVIYDADLPARSGLGSSSSFAVGLLQAIYAMRGKYVSKEQLAKDSIYVERELCAESGGWQDQIAAAFGGFNRINFNSSGFSVLPVIIPHTRKRDLQDRLLMFFTGVLRNSYRIADNHINAIKSKTGELLEMKKLVDEAEGILVSQTDISEFGRLLDYTWKFKRGIADGVSSEYIDELYSKAKKAGAVGGKLLGAGGGGFMILFAEPDRHKDIINAFSNLIQVPVTFEEDGARVMYYAHEDSHERTGDQ
jgi:D-glycero-alpha-D-manno-heptose-7-phosphate kinase